MIKTVYILVRITNTFENGKLLKPTEIFIEEASPIEGLLEEARDTKITKELSTNNLSKLSETDAHTVIINDNTTIRYAICPTQEIE